VLRPGLVQQFLKRLCLHLIVLRHLSSHLAKNPLLGTSQPGSQRLGIHCTP